MGALLLNHSPVRLEKEQKEKELMRKEKTETHFKEKVSLAGSEERIVVYLTSLRGVRKTYEDCSKVRMMLNNLGVAVDERDINLNASYKKELQNAVGNNKVSLPQVFIRGKYVGNADVMEKLNESGVLEKLLKGFPIQYPKNDCSKCGNARFVSCSECSGGWKVMNNCQYCNENGLMRCPSCCT
ncbi:unnamed protein product [Lupinus luteus]|uniref:Glutaredoxin domain-containing protein n=1 Tax=Lupinus luteus TaxID=3873 RepID=A0AAV1WM96_LUPLU